MSWFKRSGSADVATGGGSESREAPWFLGLRECVQPKDTSEAIDIVFVHGLTGNRETTWTHRSTSCFWLESLLPSDIPNARIFTYGYDADVAHFFAPASRSRIGDHAGTLLNDLARTRERSETSERPLFFVAHSLGGLVVEDVSLDRYQYDSIHGFTDAAQALLSSKNSGESHHRQILESTEGILFMGTPHCGSQLADWAKIGTSIVKLVKRLNQSIITVLQPDSEVLARIQKEFHTMIRARNEAGKHQIRITCCFEDLDTPGIGTVVPKHSAILSAYNSISIPRDHSGMTKFTDAKDPGYERVSGELWIWVRDLRKRHEQMRGKIDSDSMPTSPEQPRLLAQGDNPDRSTRHYYMGSVKNSDLLIQGNSRNLFNYYGDV